MVNGTTHVTFLDFLDLHEWSSYVTFYVKKNYTDQAESSDWTELTKENLPPIFNSKVVSLPSSEASWGAPVPPRVPLLQSSTGFPAVQGATKWESALPLMPKPQYPARYSRLNNFKVFHRKIVVSEEAYAALVEPGLARKWRGRGCPPSWCANWPAASWLPTSERWRPAREATVTFIHCSASVQAWQDCEE